MRASLAIPQSVTDMHTQQSSLAVSFDEFEERLDELKTSCTSCINLLMRELHRRGPPKKLYVSYESLALLSQADNLLRTGPRTRTHT